MSTPIQPTTAFSCGSTPGACASLEAMRARSKHPKPPPSPTAPAADSLPAIMPAGDKKPPSRGADAYDRRVKEASRQYALDAIHMLGSMINDKNVTPQARIAAARELISLAAPKLRGKTDQSGGQKLTNTQKREVIEALKDAAAQARKRTVTLEAHVVDVSEPTCDDANSP